VEAEGEVATVVMVDAELVDAGAVAELGEELYSLVDERGYKRIILDCSNVQYMSSAALNKLIVLQDKTSAVDGQLVLCGLTTAVSDVLAATRLNQKFNIQKDRAAARRSM
jgi:anti-sigma B factor antagonist